MRGLALAALAAAGCTTWPDLDPVDMEPQLDDRHGLEIFRSVHGLRIASIFQDDGLLVIFEESGEGWHARRVDPDTLAIDEVPAPPLEPGESLNLGRALSPARGVLAVVRGADLVVMVLDDGWEALPPPPVDLTGQVPGGVLAHDGRVYALGAGRLFVWDGDAWGEPVVGATIVLGGFDDQTQWVLVGDGASFSAVPIDAGGDAGAPVAGPFGAPAPSAVNGDAAGFQLHAGGSIWTFDGEAFAQGDPAPATPYAAPGSSRILVSAGDPGSGWTLFEDAVDGGQVLAPFSASIGGDPIDYVALRPAPDVARIAITMADSLAGYAVLTNRFLDLPYVGDPFAAP